MTNLFVWKVDIRLDNRFWSEKTRFLTATSLLNLLRNYCMMHINILSIHLGKYSLQYSLSNIWSTILFGIDRSREMRWACYSLVQILLSFWNGSSAHNRYRLRGLYPPFLYCILPYYSIWLSLNTGSTFKLIRSRWVWSTTWYVVSLFYRYGKSPCAIFLLSDLSKILWTAMICDTRIQLPSVQYPKLAKCRPCPEKSGNTMVIGECAEPGLTWLMGLNL